MAGFARARRHSTRACLTGAGIPSRRLIAANIEKFTTSEDSADGLVLSRMVEPTPRLAEAALAVAPFPLVKRPHPVREAWAFEESLGNVPTLPLVAFHHYVLPEVREELASLCAENTGVPPTSLNASPNAKRLFRILADVYCDGDSRYLDFYGPAYTIPTVSYSDVLEGRVTGLRDKAVFVGRATEKELIDKDTFVTVFSDPNGMNLSGVEIMATLFANLVEGRQIEPPLSHRWLTLGWGVVVAALVLALPLTPALLGSVVATAVYLGIAHWIFGRYGLWLPVAIPVLIQLPLAWLIALGWHLADQRAERLRLEGFIESVFPNWDPSARYARGAEPQREAPFQGVCLATDVQDFTRLAEEMGARELHMLLQKYYAVLGRPVA
ncbi:MAG: CHASE2 domain-containing protein [Gammaproteobacteria bacterium]